MLHFALTKDDNTELEQARVSYYQHTFEYFANLVNNTFNLKTSTESKANIITFKPLERKWDFFFMDAGGHNFERLKTAFNLFIGDRPGNGNDNNEYTCGDNWRSNDLCRALV